jgi:DNA-directed RNA polymerase subunit RPC12/RpoP
LKIILRNNFHLSSTVLDLKTDGTISPSALKRAFDALCGVSGCTCACSKAGENPAKFAFVPIVDEKGHIKAFEVQLLSGHGLAIFKCARCGHEWTPRLAERPRLCPKCKSPYWDKPRRSVGGPS